MGYRIAADSVLIAHFLFAAFAVTGGLLVAFNFAWAWLHIPVVLWSALVNLKGWTCPLTPLEQRLRVLAGQAGYTGGFIQHYVGQAVYPGGMPRRLELVAGVSVLAGNAVVYAVLLAIRPYGSNI
ncbi:MAG TPA: DUF2784 domain-containing protein [Steroidobacteraceae bacterium]|jgi:hypothetical protein|nr:DUF2784 domain-containing protein [Steroidobacteraceae bacterium]